MNCRALIRASCRGSLKFCEAVIVAFARVAKTARPTRNSVGISAFYNSNVNNFNPAYALISTVKIESKGGPVFRLASCRRDDVMPSAIGRQSAQRCCHRAVTVRRCPCCRCRVGHLMSGQEEAVTGVGIR